MHRRLSWTGFDGNRVADQLGLEAIDERLGSALSSAWPKEPTGEHAAVVEGLV